jgi:hypothetical protein
VFLFCFLYVLFFVGSLAINTLSIPNNVAYNVGSKSIFAMLDQVNRKKNINIYTKLVEIAYKIKLYPMMDLIIWILYPIQI